MTRLASERTVDPLLPSGCRAAASPWPSWLGWAAWASAWAASAAPAQPAAWAASSASAACKAAHRQLRSSSNAATWMNQTSQQNEGVLLWGQRWLHREPPPWQSLGTQNWFSITVTRKHTPSPKWPILFQGSCSLVTMGWCSQNWFVSMTVLDPCTFT